MIKNSMFKQLISAFAGKQFVYQYLCIRDNAIKFKLPKIGTKFTNRTSIVTLFIFFLNFFVNSTISTAGSYNLNSLSFNGTPPDTIPDNQILYNGRVWRNLYYMVENDQFLFTKDFLPGSLTMNGKTFPDVAIRYDIFNDEILTHSNSGGILQLNKEMLDSFSICFQNKVYNFIKIPEGSLESLDGFVYVIYKGKSALYVKHIKKIDYPTVENEHDNFYQQSRIYFVNHNIVHLITGKNDLFKLMDDDKAKIKDFIKKNHLRVSKKMPESFYPVIRYYDSLNL